MSYNLSRFCPPRAREDRTQIGRVYRMSELTALQQKIMWVGKKEARVDVPSYHFGLRKNSSPREIEGQSRGRMPTKLLAALEILVR